MLSSRGAAYYFKIFQRFHPKDSALGSIGIWTGFDFAEEREQVRGTVDGGLKPFPEHRHEVQQADLLIIQPGIFEEGLKHGFRYPAEHISRTTLYTFEQTLHLATRLKARRVLFVHLEEYWNRSYDDYRALEPKNQRVRFAYDGMQLAV